MAIFHSFHAKLRSLFAHQQDDSEFTNEVEIHLQLLTTRFIQHGMSPEEASAAARRQFGNPALLHQRRREMSSFLSLANLGRDLRFAARQLYRNPLLTIIAIVSLALGIGANTAIFSVAKRVLFDTLPVKNPNELRLLTWTSGPTPDRAQPVPPIWGDISSSPNGGYVSNVFSYPIYEALRQQFGAFQSLSAFKDVSMTATVDGTPNLIAAEMLTGNAFDLLGITPILGRFLNASDDAVPGSGPVAVITDAFWSRHFGRSPSAVGKTISLNGVSVTLIGVTPASFTGLQMGSPVEIFVPLTMQPLLVPRSQHGDVSLLNNPQSWWIQIIARLRPDLPEAQAESQAQAQLDAVLRAAALPVATSPKSMESFHLKLEPGDRGQDSLQGAFAQPSYILLALSGLVLLLACVNLANLLLARAASRQREMSTRLALGAHRSHILRQLLTESLLLSTLGGAAGLALGYLGRNLIPNMLANPLQAASMRSDFDWQILAFTAAVSICTGILFGLVPAWQATRVEVSSALKDASHATSSRSGLRLGKGLVVFQIALSTILLIGAALFMRTLVNLNRTPLGFNAGHMLLFQLNPPRARYNDAQSVALYRQLEEKLAAIPGVRSISLSNIAVIGDGHSGDSFHISGTSDKPARVQANGVSTDFFTTMGIPILGGRSFTAQDTSTSPVVAVINNTLARQFFPNQNPIGRTFETDTDEVAGSIQIIGIAADTRYAALRTPTPPTFYLSYRQTLEPSRMVVEIRTWAEPGSVLTQCRAAVTSLDRDLPLIDVRTMTEQIATTISGERIFAQLTTAFGILALILACIGIYGIMAYTVARRTSEIGIRMALGAQTAQVLSMILREVSWMAIEGVTLGIGAALWLARFISAMLYGLKPSDPLTLASVATLLILIALLAGFGPARRASRINPTQALRHD
jgi:predicted permease